MPTESSSACIGGRSAPWIGALVSLHFAIVCGIKLQQGIRADVCWMSHVSLAFTGAGLILRSRSLLSVALIGVLIPHAIWLLDCFGWVLLGSFPLGITGYLEDADARTWIATAHHFYLIPLLLFVVVRWRVFVPGAFPWVVLLFAVVSVYSRFVLPEARNVNSVFVLLPSVDLALVRRLNALPTVPFLVFLNLWVSLVMLWPTVRLMRRYAGNEIEQDSRAESSHEALGPVR